jgi:hypothetical protein
MTSSTRRRLTACLVLGLIALPAEALLLPVAMTPDPAAAAAEWVADRSADELRAAASSIDEYPGIYRRAIMARLDPAERSSVWQSQFQSFLDAHPELNLTQTAIVREALTLASPEAFRPPLGQEVQARIRQVYGEAQLHLGAEAAKELFVTLGPAEVRQANALPLTQRLADRVRGWRAPSAAPTGCNCNVDIDTCTVWPEPEWLECSELFTCDFDLSWPMCGPLWSWACTGWCRVLIWPEIY